MNRSSPSAAPVRCDRYCWRVIQEGRRRFNQRTGRSGWWTGGIASDRWPRLGLLTTAGVRTVLVNGTTAEFASLSGAERQRVVEYCRGRRQGLRVSHRSGGDHDVQDTMGDLAHSAVEPDRLYRNSIRFAAAAKAGRPPGADQRGDPAGRTSLNTGAPTLQIRPSITQRPYPYITRHSRHHSTCG